MEAEFTDDGVVDRGRAAVESADVVAGPQGAEPLAGQGEFADEFDEPGVVGVVPDGGAQRGDEIGGGFRPVLLEGLFLGIEEEGTQPVLAGPQPGESATAMGLEARTSNARPSTNAGICRWASSSCTRAGTCSGRIRRGALGRVAARPSRYVRSMSSSRRTRASDSSTWGEGFLSRPRSRRR